MLTGIIPINKPVGLTSHDVVVRIRQLSGSPQPKVGHTGTLDPFATGLLLVAVGQATRLIRFSHSWDKTYQAVAQVGTTSTTDDLMGKLTIQQTNPSPPSQKQLEEIIKKFTGQIKQHPPHYAAIKVGGKKLYEYARANQKVKVEPRKVTIYQLSLDASAWPKLNLEVKCSTGTYLRALARDIGRELGSGAHLTELTRVKLGPFSLTQAQDLEELEPETLSAKFSPVKTLVSSLPKVQISTTAYQQLKHGQFITLPEANQIDSEYLAVETKDDGLVAVVTIVNKETVKPVVVLNSGEKQFN